MIQALKNIAIMIDDHIEYQSQVFYVYRITAEDDSVPMLGLISSIELNKKNRSNIFPHELTQHDKERAYFEVLKKTAQQSNPILLVHKMAKNIEKLLNYICLSKPDYRYSDGGSHEIWRVCETAQLDMIEKTYASVNGYYIADGHHRYAALNQYAESTQKPIDMLAYIVSEDKVNISSFYRVVILESMNEKSFMARLSRKFILEKVFSNEDKENLLIFCKDGNYKLSLDIVKSTKKTVTSCGVQEQFDLLSYQILRDILGIIDLQKTNLIEYFPDSLSLIDIKSHCNEFEDYAIFKLPHITMNMFFLLIDAGYIFSPHNTHFYPKPQGNLFVMQLYGYNIDERATVV